VNSFVGVNFSNIRPGKAKLDLNDPVDKAVYDLTGGYVFRFYGNDNQIWRSLQLLKRVKAKSTEIVREQPRVTGRVLRDFYMALQVEQRDIAEECLRYLKENNRLDPLNLAFLKVQLLAELGRWTELLELPEMPDLLKMRRPLAVTRALIKAVYIDKLSEFERNKLPAEGVEYFKKQVFPLYGDLFRSRSVLKEPEILKSFMMFAVMDLAPKPELRDEILNTEGLSSEDYGYLCQLANLLPLQKTQTNYTLENAQMLVLAGSYDEALKMAEKLPPSILRARILSDCAYEIQTIASERAALQAVRELAPEDIKTFMLSRRHREFIEGIGGKEIHEAAFALDQVLPTDWPTFISRINKGLFSPARALAIAQKGVIEWDPEELKASPGDIERLIDLLNERRSDQEEELLGHILPYLFAFFLQDRSWPRNEFKRIYLALLFILVYGSYGGESDLEVFSEMAIGLLRLGVNKLEYKEILDDTATLWDEYYSESTLNWALDFADSLVSYPCASEDDRLQFIKGIINRLVTFSRRVKPEQWQLLKVLLHDLDLFEEYKTLLESATISQVELESRTEELLALLNGKTVGIYTLDEPVAVRVRQLLEELSPEVRVQVSNDKVGNDRLKQLSRTADIFVIAAGCAKHAATTFIESNRPKHLPILWAQGKGSASMMRAIYDHIRSAC